MSTAVAYSMNAYIQRFGWAQLFINGQSYGYYLILESVDGQYLKSRFNTNDGPLYKCTANLTWIGPEVENYSNLMCGSVCINYIYSDTNTFFEGILIFLFLKSPCYDPKTDEADDYTKLRDFLYVLNFAPDDTFAQDIAEVFDVDLFIRTFVFEVATANFDGLRK